MAITTMYNGIEYRSRLEAKWAAFFTRIGWHFTYEPFDGDGYIPDFLVYGPAPLMVEVKPAVTDFDYRQPIDKAVTGLKGHWTHDILIVGTTPLTSALSNSWACRPAGLLGEELWNGWDFAAGIWITCKNCDSHAIMHDYQSYMSRPCGCYEGDHFNGPARTALLEQAWDAACNDVKWRGRPEITGKQIVPPFDTQATNEAMQRQINAASSNPAGVVKMFDTVEHDSFGTGLVLAVTGDGDSQIAKVDFGIHEGTKNLLLRYAPVRIIKSFR